MIGGRAGVEGRMNCAGREMIIMMMISLGLFLFRSTRHWHLLTERLLRTEHQTPVFLCACFYYPYTNQLR